MPAGKPVVLPLNDHDGYDFPAALLSTEESGSILDSTGTMYYTTGVLADEMRERFGTCLPDGVRIMPQECTSMLGCRFGRMHA